MDNLNRIGEVRKLRGLSQAALAGLCDTSNQQISRLESGKRELTLAWMARLASALQCSPVDLLPEEMAQRHTTIGQAPPDAGGAPFRYVAKPHIKMPSWPIAVWDDSDSWSPYGCIHFGEAFMRKYDINPINCEIVSVHDDSMAKTLPAGCTVLVDRGKTELVDGGLYAVVDEGMLLIRRAVQRGEQWIFQADDPRKPMLAGTHYVIGFVLWVGGVSPRSEHWEVPEEERPTRARMIQATSR